MKVIISLIIIGCILFSCPTIRTAEFSPSQGYPAPVKMAEKTELTILSEEISLKLLISSAAECAFVSAAANNLTQD